MEERSIGSVYGGNPRFKGMESFARVRWRRYGLIPVHFIKSNIFLFNFESEAGKYRVLEGGPYTFDRRPMVLIPWKFKLKIELETIQKWFDLGPATRTTMGVLIKQNSKQNRKCIMKVFVFRSMFQK